MQQHSGLLRLREVSGSRPLAFFHLPHGSSRQLPGSRKAIRASHRVRRLKFTSGSQHGARRGRPSNAALTPRDDSSVERYDASTRERRPEGQAALSHRESKNGASQGALRLRCELRRRRISQDHNRRNVLHPISKTALIEVRRTPSARHTLAASALSICWSSFGTPLRAIPRMHRSTRTIDAPGRSSMPRLLMVVSLATDRAGGVRRLSPTRKNARCPPRPAVSSTARSGCRAHA